MKRAAFLLLALALLLPGGARANGDPASDGLISGKTFFPFEAPISDSAKNDLNKTVLEANAKGYKIRVAIIAFTGDLGSATALWAKPQQYAEFLGKEDAFAWTGPLLVAMPAGFGFYNANKPVDKELAVLKGIKPGTIPTDLTNSAADAVRRLAAANGVKVSKPSSGSSTQDRILILVGALVVLALVLLFPTRWVRKRGRGGGQSPSAEPR